MYMHHLLVVLLFEGCVLSTSTKTRSGLKFKRKDKKRFTIKPAGGDITFECKAVGEAPITYTWLKNGRKLLSGRMDSKLLVNKPRLKLTFLVHSDSANYTCVAKNKYGEISSSTVLSVQQRVRASPYIEKASVKNQTVVVGDSVLIPCYELITGTIPDFRWFKWAGTFNETLLAKLLKDELGVEAFDEKVIKVIHGKFYRPKRKVTYRVGKLLVRGVGLHLTNVTQDERGFYTCVATNHIGTDYASMYLEVRNPRVLHVISKVQGGGHHTKMIIVVLLVVLCLICITLIAGLVYTIRKRKHSNNGNSNLLTNLRTVAATDERPPRNIQQLLPPDDRRNSDVESEYTVVDPALRSGMYIKLDDIPMCNSSIDPQQNSVSS